ncbi:MAG: hypothetical protein C3F14_04285 [Deltaproteobacteria bacterium]|nr:MAG: hypothetical protein C3F14_04285 [Deltaproteobacteria bacterium]
MSRRTPIRRRIRVAAALLFFLLVPPAFPRTADAGHRFPGYPEEVRRQAERVAAIAGPGREGDLVKEVRLLRIRMHSLGILSMNALPDLVYERAVNEGWKNEVTPQMRALREVSPFSVPLWAWLVKEDLARLSLADFTQDMEGLSGSLKRFAPSLIGYAVWLISLFSAAGCWFVLWGSVSLFLRARPSLEGDIQRFLKTPNREYLAPVIAVMVFLLPLLAGFGLAVAACIWLLLSAAYVRRIELAILSSGVLILAALLLGGGVLHSLQKFGGDGGSGGWMTGEGDLSTVRFQEEAGGKGPLSEETLSWMIRFEQARRQMQAGNAAAAEKLWTSLVEEGRELPEVLNNRGIVRARQGRTAAALADFEAAVSKSPSEGPALWNAYQMNLQLFRLEEARRIQPEAWERIRSMPPYFLRPADMEQDEWIASPLPVGEIWKAIFRFRGDWIREAGESDFFGMFFHPLSPRTALLFLAVVWFFSTAWKLLSRKLWVHGTCRACGSRSLVVRSREASDICPPCRVKIGGGIRAGAERNRRVQGIVMHRSYVRAASLLVPGSGALWAGKEIRVLLFGAALSVALAFVTTGLGGMRAGDLLVSELQTSVAVGGGMLAGVLWAAGAAWGIRSFSVLQRAHNIAGERI